MDAVLGVGITGHIHLRRTTTRLVRQALADLLRASPKPLHGVSCLAPGPDQTFIELIRELGGTYDVILPARDYRDRVIRPRGRRHFDELLAGAAEVVPTEFAHDHPAAYALANNRLVERCRELIAVWDGMADDRPGSTAHAVALARRAGVPVIPLWPTGAERLARPAAELGRARPQAADRLSVGIATR
ncbi:hypothetical protein [Actinoplanes sp. NPDC026619]|uniref:hypothetical protein n=1 Tax=Actinoplanes sp. NPDC026619 TaxID=3155798 RepID=UPI0033F37566